MTKLPLKVKANGSIRNVKGSIDNEEVQAILVMLNGSTVEAHVYSSTNICFSVTEKTIRDAWKALDKVKYYWISEKLVERIVKRFTLLNEYRNTLAVPLPNLYCESTPAEIDMLIKSVEV